MIITSKIDSQFFDFYKLHINERISLNQDKIHMYAINLVTSNRGQNTKTYFFICIRNFQVSRYKGYESC